MKKTTRIIAISIVLVLSIIFIYFKISGFATGGVISKDSYSWTKAICNETHCQDYQIFCNEDKLVRQTPVTGAVISISENWIDPRNEININRVCEWG